MSGDVFNKPGCQYYLYFCESLVFMKGAHYYRPIKPSTLQASTEETFHRAVVLQPSARVA